MFNQHPDLFALIAIDGHYSFKGAQPQLLDYSLSKVLSSNLFLACSSAVDGGSQGFMPTLPLMLKPEHSGIVFRSNKLSNKASDSISLFDVQTCQKLSMPS